MHIKVIYKDGKSGVIDPYQLDGLISSKKIKKFQRSGKWVTIGVDPIREIKEDYLEVAKREKFLKKTKRK
jgi:hypothetical protein